jgi:hypothetical protein
VDGIIGYLWMEYLNGWVICGCFGFLLFVIYGYLLFVICGWVICGWNVECKLIYMHSSSQEQGRHLRGTKLPNLVGAPFELGAQGKVPLHLSAALAKSHPQVDRCMY